jgi:dTDP-4-dehydrorhamnose 3,5-epimerase
VNFQATDIPGVFVVVAEPSRDHRGFFARLYCPDEFAAAGIEFTPVEVNLSRNMRRHTLRGMHYQDHPHAEAKLVHVTRGSVYDVVVDLRRNGPSFGRWAGFELDAEAARALFVPEGCAHGFLTLTSDADVLYHMGRRHIPGLTRGYRWNDPVLDIHWPAEPELVSQADMAWPDFSR